VLLATAETKEEVKAAPKAATEKKAPPAKAPVKPLPQMMEEDVIPSLKAILEAQQDLSDLQLVFQDNKVSNVAMLFKVLGLCDFREGKSP
jgi:ribosome assembly protein YihI (activator of Der GTPase)